MAPYSMQDLNEARAELERQLERFANYSGNNPNKYQSDIKSARRAVREIETSLKDDGLLPMSEHEQLERTLDRQFPNARSKDVVEFEGRRFRRRFFPLERSRSRKTVTDWGKSWELLDE